MPRRLLGLQAGFKMLSSSVSDTWSTMSLRAALLLLMLSLARFCVLTSKEYSCVQYACEWADLCSKSRTRIVEAAYSREDQIRRHVTKRSLCACETTSSRKVRYNSIQYRFVHTSEPPCRLSETRCRTRTTKLPFPQASRDAPIILLLP